MTLQELTDKMHGGQALSEPEQREFFSLLDAEFGKLKEEQPEKYLELIKEFTGIIHDLNTELKQAREELK